MVSINQEAKAAHRLTASYSKKENCLLNNRTYVTDGRQTTCLVGRSWYVARKFENGVSSECSIQSTCMFWIDLESLFVIQTCKAWTKTSTIINPKCGGFECLTPRIALFEFV